MNQVLYLKSIDSTFNRIDEKIIHNNFSALSYHFKQTGKPIDFIINLVKMCYFFIRNADKFDLVFVMFVDYYSIILALLVKILNKKLIIAVGGYDAVSFPEFGLGVFSNPLKAFCAKIAYRSADLIMPNHESLEYGKNTYIDDIDRYTGVKYFIKDIKTEFKVVYNGYHNDFADVSLCNTKDKDMVLLIGRIKSMDNFYRKGHDLFIQAAKILKDKKFIIIGLDNEIKDIALKKFHAEDCNNLIIFSGMSQKNLKSYMQKAWIIAQPSISEGMPNTLCEGMLHKCIPVGSNVNGIPLAIGNTGVIFDKRDPLLLVEALKKAFSMETGDSARNRILELFSIEKREKMIIDSITNLLRNEI